LFRLAIRQPRATRIRNTRFMEGSLRSALLTQIKRSSTYIAMLNLRKAGLELQYVTRTAIRGSSLYYVSLAAAAVGRIESNLQTPEQ